MLGNIRYITIHGDVPSKKNSKQIVRIGSRFALVPSKAYKRWHAEASAQLSGAEAVPSPCAVSLRLYTSTARRGDLTNKAESVMDLLVDCGVLPDDSWRDVPEIRLTYGGIDRENPRMEVEFSAPSQAQPGC